MDKKMKISLILGGMCVALSCGIAIQVKTISNIGTTTSRNSTENELRDAILRTKENYDNLYADEEKAEKLNLLTRLSLSIKTTSSIYIRRRIS